MATVHVHNIIINRHLIIFCIRDWWLILIRYFISKSVYCWFSSAFSSWKIIQWYIFSNYFVCVVVLIEHTPYDNGCIPLYVGGDIILLTNFQSAFTYFAETLKRIFHNAFPVIRVKKRYRNRLPWLTDGLKNAIKYKNKLYKLYSKFETSYNKKCYTQYKNK